MRYLNFLRTLRLTAIALMLVAANHAVSLEKEDLILVFQDDFETGMDGWTFRDPENWRVEKEGDTDNHVLSLFVPGTTPRNYLGPQSVAIPKGITAGDFILETRIRHLGEEYAHQDLCVLYSVSGDDNYYYTHIAPVSDEGANTIFIVDDAERRSIATQRNDGTKWGDVWHDLRIVRDAGAGTISVFFDDMNTPIMAANDTTFTAGSFGLGSFNDIGCFDDVKIWARPVAFVEEGFVSLFDGATLAGTINGQQSAEFIDNDLDKYQATGILALQLKAGPPMKVQFKDIYLKELP